MGLSSLSIEAQETLKEIARMSWGSGLFEGSSGGSGRMGVIYNENGEARVIKFNTNSYERSFGDSLADDPQMLESSNNLRELLKNLAESAGLKGKDLADVYKKLGLGADGKGTMPKTLLDRKIVAKIVTKIGGDQIWKDAWAGVDKKSYASGWKTQLKNLRPALAGNGMSANVRLTNKLVNFSRNELHDFLMGESFREDLEGNAKDAIRRLMDDESLTAIMNSGALKDITREKFIGAYNTWLRLEKHDSKDPAAIRDSFVHALKTYVPARHASAYGVSPDQLRELGVSSEQFDHAITDLSVKFGLSIEQRQNVAKMTMAYLASKLGDPESRATLPPANELVNQIKDGKFLGSFIGLLNCGVINVNINSLVIPAENLFGKDGAICDYLSKLNPRDCEDMAFMLGKCQLGDKDRDSKDAIAFPADKTHPELNFTNLSGIRLHTLITMKEKQSAILNNYRTTGKFSFDDIYRQVLGEKPSSKDVNARDRFWRMVLKSDIKLTNKMGAVKADDQIGYVSVMTDRIMDPESLMLDFGLNFEDATKVKNSGWDNSIKLRGGTPITQIGTKTFAEMTKETAFYDLNKDIGRAGEGSTFTVGGNKPIIVPPGAKMDDKITEGLRDTLFEQLSQMLGYDNKSDKPLPPQLKTALYSCNQAGMSVFALAGGNSVQYANSARTFELDQNGNLHFTISTYCPPLPGDPQNADRLCTAHYVIAKDGSSELVDFSAQPVKQYSTTSTKQMNDDFINEVNNNFSERFRDPGTNNKITGDWFRDLNHMNNLTPDEVKNDIKGDPMNIIDIRTFGRFCFLDGVPVKRDPSIQNPEENTAILVSNFFKKTNVDDSQKEMQEALRYLMTQGPQLWPNHPILDNGLEGQIPQVMQNEMLTCADIKQVPAEQGGGFDVHFFGAYHNVQAIRNKDGTDVYFDNAYDNKLTYSAVCHLSIDPSTHQPVLTVKTPLEVKTDFHEMSSEKYFGILEYQLNELMQGKMKPDGLPESMLGDLEKVNEFVKTAPKELKDKIQQFVWESMTTNDPDDAFPQTTTKPKMLERVVMYIANIERAQANQNKANPGS